MGLPLVSGVVSVMDRVIAGMAELPFQSMRWMAEQRAQGDPDWHAANRRLQEAMFMHRSSRSAGTRSWDSYRHMHEMRDEVYSVERRYAGSTLVLDFFDSARASRPFSDSWRQVVWAWQRVSRGWDDRATWSMDTYVFRTLGEQLLHLAATTHGWPSGLTDEAGAVLYPEFEDWAAALTFHGGRLLAAASVSEGAGDLDREAYEAVYAAGEESLRWVADNIQSLWD